MRTAATVRKFESREWMIYRDLRLRALAESPDAFGSTLAIEQVRADEDWATRLATSATSGLDLPLLAQADGRSAGLAWARTDARADALNKSVVNLYQMWVAPESRGRGLGRMLLRAAIDWARTLNAQAVHLGVTCGETSAMRLYTREGFQPSGQREALRPGSPLFAQPMRLLLLSSGK